VSGSLALALAVALAGCAVSPTDAGDDTGGKDDRGGSGGFYEVDPTHSTAAFRHYVEHALTELADHDSELARLTLVSIRAGKVRIDELADLTCADFERVRADLPDAGLSPEDYGDLHRAGSDALVAIQDALDGYMWSNRIYVSRGQDARHLASTLIHEVNHVINRSEVGYYDDLPTSAFIHEYRAFQRETEFDPEAWDGVDLVDYVITEYELDRSKIHPEVLANPLTPRLLPDADAWRARRVEDDVEDSCP